MIMEPHRKSVNILRHSCNARDKAHISHLGPKAGLYTDSIPNNKRSFHLLPNEEKEKRRIFTQVPCEALQHDASASRKYKNAP
jgi:hypothetical protein